MALTKISRSLLDTGVSDSSDATAITIDSSENVGIGTTSPHTHLVLNGGTESQFALQSSNTGTGAGNGSLLSIDTLNNTYLWNYESANMLFGTNNSEKMRITSGGDVGIGTSSPNAYTNYTVLTIDSPSSGTGAIIDLEYRTTRALSIFSESDASNLREIRNKALVFGTNNTERMRINSSGNTMFGTTSETYSSARLHVGNGNATYAYAFGTIANYSPFYILNAAGTGVRLDNNSTSWTSSSDETLKENIEDIGNVLDIVKNYRTVKFNFIGQEEEKIGFIAQDWQNDFPQVISVDERNNKLGIQYTETIPVLLKAIQEQQEQIEAMQAEINTLKGE